MMSLRSSGHILLLLASVVLFLGSSAIDYETFLRQHYDNPKSNVGNRYCNAMMQRRRMTKPCKEVNTFIHDTKQEIFTVCGDKGVALANGLRKSVKQFRVTTCNLKGSSTLLPCDYRENFLPRYIVIACENGKPVHYDEGQIGRRTEYEFQ